PVPAPAAAAPVPAPAAAAPVPAPPAANGYSRLLYPWLLGPLTVYELARGGAQTVGLYTALARKALAWQREALLGPLRPR
ncbi:MAG: hypothetical protein WCE83_05560, partial [Candidatus Baltobacteraceae bacterium]